MNESAVKLTLLHTNDIHSHFEEFARVAGFVRHTRLTVPQDRLLLVDCGDFLDRARTETEGTQGRANRTLLEEMGYDAAAMGNNEGLSYSKRQLDELFGGAPFPVVCANLVDRDGGGRPAWMKPVAIVEKAGLRIGLLGLTAAFRDFYELLGWDALDPFETAAEWVPLLREQADVVVLLSHLGLRHDERMAAEVDGIDVILGAHTHHLLETALKIGRTTVCAAGKFGRHIGIVDIARDEAGTLVVEGRSLPTAAMETDERVEALIAASGRDAAAAMSGIVATLREPLPAGTGGLSPLATLLASGIRKLTGAEIGLVNAGQLLDGLPAGAVTEGDIHAICPSPINPCLIRLPGRLLRRALEESLLPEFIDREIMGFGFRGRVLGSLCVDGVEMAVDSAMPPFERIVSVTVGGEPLDDGREYTIGTLDMFTFGVGYVGLKEGRVLRYFLPEFIRDVLADSLNDEGAVADCRRPRWLAAKRDGE